ncbi:MAG TPA: hypothetical protein VI749_05930 [Candidatus Omnitrophota bacterium]|nr:hypothetical protein [Candidatus Omnitrophota bacterium]
MNILRSFEEEKNLVLEKLDLLYDSIQNLHYEGKMSFSKNTKVINETVQQLKSILMNHMDLDDQVVFPFVSKHVPILEPMINFLNSERNEFTAQLKSFEVLFQGLIQGHAGAVNYMLLEKLREKGTYVVCIVRNHMQAEIEGIYKVLDQKLKLVEKKELYRLIQKYMTNKTTSLKINAGVNCVK